MQIYPLNSQGLLASCVFVPPLCLPTTRPLLSRTGREENHHQAFGLDFLPHQRCSPNCSKLRIYQKEEIFLIQNAFLSLHSWEGHVPYVTCEVKITSPCEVTEQKHLFHPDLREQVKRLLMDSCCVLLTELDGLCVPIWVYGHVSSRFSGIKNKQELGMFILHTNRHKILTTP